MQTTQAEYSDVASGWGAFTLDDKIDFLTMRKLHQDGCSINDPIFRRNFVALRLFFKAKSFEEIEEIFSTIKPYANPTDIADYLWAVRGKAKWLFYSNEKKSKSLDSQIKNEPEPIVTRFKIMLLSLIPLK